MMMDIVLQFSPAVEVHDGDVDRYLGKQLGCPDAPVVLGMVTNITSLKLGIDRNP